MRAAGTVSLCRACPQMSLPFRHFICSWLLCRRVESETVILGGQYGSPGCLLKIVITLKEQLWNPHLPLSSSASLTPHSLLPLPSNSATWRDTWLATGASGGRPGHLSQPKGFTANSLHTRFRPGGGIRHPGGSHSRNLSFHSEASTDRGWQCWLTSGRNGSLGHTNGHASPSLPARAAGMHQSCLLYCGAWSGCSALPRPSRSHLSPNAGKEYQLLEISMNFTIPKTRTGDLTVLKRRKVKTILSLKFSPFGNSGFLWKPTSQKRFCTKTVTTYVSNDCKKSWSILFAAGEYLRNSQHGKKNEINYNSGNKEYCGMVST